MKNLLALSKSVSAPLSEGEGLGLSFNGQAMTLSPDRADIPEAQRRDKGESGTSVCKNALKIAAYLSKYFCVILLKH